jgi:hypothetical protein
LNGIATLQHVGIHISLSGYPQPPDRGIAGAVLSVIGSLGESVTLLLFPSPARLG